MPSIHSHTRHSTVKELLSIDEARALLIEGLAPVAIPDETLPLAAARGRVTSSDVHAATNVPPFAASAMDGYAVCSTDAIFSDGPPYRLDVQGTSSAGHPFEHALKPDCAVRIFTGAMVPERCDAIVIQENTTREGARVVIDEKPAVGRWVRPIAHDVARGARILQSGRRLDAFALAALASCGVAQVNVHGRVQVAIFSTGDELREAGAALAPGQIYDSNRLVLRELLSDVPVEVTDLGILPDDPDVTAQTIDEAARTHHALLTSGGVSVGESDYVRGAIERVGRLEFWKVAIKPGKPLAYGRARNSVFFGLPGNPVSTIVTFLLLVKPALERLAGATPAPPLRVWATAEIDIEHEAGRAEFQRGVVREANGELRVMPTGDQSSNRIDSFNGANCLIELPKENPGILAETRVQVLLFRGLVT
jgi:molybdopterin molybdotransferase